MRRIKKGTHIEAENHERWLLTYADLITLLLALFVLLWSLSKVIVPDDVFSNPWKEQLERQRRLEELLKSIVEKNNLSNIISLRAGMEKTTLILSGDASFQSGSDVLTDSVTFALKTIYSVFDSLSKVVEQINIEGHTDNVPINTPEFSSNLELSTARAVSTAKFLITELFIDRSKISVQGFGEFRKIAPNTDDDGRKKNRRVEISLIANRGLFQ
jgi:chemotaxis protein MotB